MKWRKGANLLWENGGHILCRYDEPPRLGEVGPAFFLLYMLFVSGLLTGKLFPKFVRDDPMPNPEEFRSIFQIHTTYAGYAALVFWSFVAGYSERFVTNIIGQFERDATPAPKGDTKAEPPKPANPKL